MLSRTTEPFQSLPDKLIEVSRNISESLQGKRTGSHKVHPLFLQVKAKNWKRWSRCAYWNARAIMTDVKITVMDSRQEHIWKCCLAIPFHPLFSHVVVPQFWNIHVFAFRLIHRTTSFHPLYMYKKISPNDEIFLPLMIKSFRFVLEFYFCCHPSSFQTIRMSGRFLSRIPASWVIEVSRVKNIRASI